MDEIIARETAKRSSTPSIEIKIEVVRLLVA